MLPSLELVLLLLNTVDFHFNVDTQALTPCPHHWRVSIDSTRTSCTFQQYEQVAIVPSEKHGGKHYNLFHNFISPKTVNISACIEVDGHIEKKFRIPPDNNVVPVEVFISVNLISSKIYLKFLEYFEAELKKFIQARVQRMWTKSVLPTWTYIACYRRSVSWWAAWKDQRSKKRKKGDQA